jgi:hypothetical protein
MQQVYRLVSNAGRYAFPDSLRIGMTEFPESAWMRRASIASLFHKQFNADKRSRFFGLT